jgi:hypothetical protein
MPSKYQPKGRPTGEKHPRAKLTDVQVDRMRAIYDSNEGRMHKYDRLGYQTLAEMFKCSPSTARDICKARTRI